MKDLVFQELIGDESFDASTLCSQVPFTQAPFYGDWQKTLGRRIKRFIVKDKDEVIMYFQMIKYPLLFGKNYFYIPYGPVSKTINQNILIELKEKLIEEAKKENAVFVRLDFTPAVNDKENIKLFSKVLKHSPKYTYKSSYFQLRSEWFLDLKKTEEEILKEMHEKTRYSVRLADRRGVKTEIVTSNFDEYFDTFCELMEVTSKRNGFHLHSRDYYESIFKNLKEDNTFLSISRYEGKILSIYLVINYSGIANYVFGCSGNDFKELAPTYLAHFEAIKHSKKIGAEFYNFGAISSEGKGMDSLTVFKKKFGGFEVKHSDFFDVIVEPFWYYLYNFRKFFKNK